MLKTMLQTISASDAALFLDLDGTLAPLCDTPDAVRPDGARSAMLREARERLNGRVAIISGRTIIDIDAILEGACVAVAGVHGLQRRSAAGVLEASTAHPRIEAVAEVMARFALATPGLLVELKDQCVAMHYRGAPRAEAAVVEFVGRLASQEGLEIQPGHMVMDLRTPGPNKGASVRAFLSEVPFRGYRPIYVGDDLTDEAGFVEATAHGGLGVLVGGARPSAAVSRLENPSAVLAWIEASLRRGVFEFPLFNEEAAAPGGAAAR